MRTLIIWLVMLAQVGSYCVLSAKSGEGKPIVMDLPVVASSYSQDYSIGGGAAGFVFLGPLGLLFGFAGSGCKVPVQLDNQVDYIVVPKQYCGMLIESVRVSWEWDGTSCRAVGISTRDGKKLVFREEQYRFRLQPR